jgi:hypothetical protein
MPSSAEIAVAYERMMARTEQGVVVVDGVTCVLFTGAGDKDGYGIVNVAGMTMFAHRLAFSHRHGYLPPAVMHRCDVPACVADAHHMAGTQADNLADARAKGRMSGPPHPRGVDNPNVKLTPAKVRRIRALIAAGQSQRAVAARFGVSQHAVCLIVNGQTWSHVA